MPDHIRENLRWYEVEWDSQEWSPEKLLAFFKEHGVDLSLCRNSPCPGPMFEVGDHVRGAPNVWGYSAAYTGEITEIFDELGKIKYWVLVDLPPNRFGLDWLRPCGCALEKIELRPEYKPQDMQNTILGKIEEALPDIQLFDSIEDALGAALDDD